MTSVGKRHFRWSPEAEWSNWEWSRLGRGSGVAWAEQRKRDGKGRGYRALLELEKASRVQSRERIQREAGEACRVRNGRTQGHTQEHPEVIGSHRRILKEQDTASFTNRKRAALWDGGYGSCPCGGGGGRGQ